MHRARWERGVIRLAEVEIKIIGLEKLTNELKEAYKVYPDITLMTMRKCGTKLGRIAREQTDAVGVKVVTGNLKKGYKFTIPSFGVGSMGFDIQGEFHAETPKNPHMHLIEHGHMIVPRGPSKKSEKRSTDTSGESRIKSLTEHTSRKGRTRAYGMIEKTLEIFDQQYEGIAEEAMNKILRKAGLD